MIYTSALIEKEFDRRKEEYLQSLNQVRSFEIEPWIIEARNIKSSFFDVVSRQVLYPQVHNDSLRNKGVNESMSICTCIPLLPFDDEDIVIKLTGRYFLKDSYFIDLVEATQNDYDVWGVFGKNFVAPGHLVTGCFAMRWKHYKKMLQDMDYVKAEVDYIAIEQLFSEHIRDNHLRVNSLNDLHLMARVFYSGSDACDYEF